MSDIHVLSHHHQHQLEVFHDAKALSTTNPARAVSLLEDLLAHVDVEGEEEAIPNEQDVAAVVRDVIMHPVEDTVEIDLGEEVHGGMAVTLEHVAHLLIDCYARLKNGEGLVRLLKTLRPKFVAMPKAKTAKMVRLVIDALGKVPESSDMQIALCREYIEWCVEEKRTFLRHRIQSRLASLLLQREENQEALSVLKELQTEVKKLDDKPLLVEVYLLESKAHLALKNVPRSKASLTAARSAANAIYVGPVLQAEIDMQGGTLNSSDKDFRTAYSYFYEAFESYSQLADDPMAAKALKYMALCKIMMGLGDDLPMIFNTKPALKYSGSDLDAMRRIAGAYKERSLNAFGAALEAFPRELHGDELVARHLNDLQSTLLEGNLIRIVEPFSRVHVARVAQLINLPVERVEAKLSEMILDGKFRGILDQGEGVLVVFDEPEPDATYDASLQAIESMGSVVDSLMRRSEKLHA